MSPVHRSKILAHLLLVSILCSTGSPWHADDRADHGVDAATYHTGHHELATPSADGAPEHCAICHLLQSLRTVAVARARGALDTGLKQTVSFDSIAPSLGAALFHLPSRAPPA